MHDFPSFGVHISRFYANPKNFARLHYHRTVTFRISESLANKNGSKQIMRLREEALFCTLFLLMYLM